MTGIEGISGPGQNFGHLQGKPVPEGDFSQHLSGAKQPPAGFSLSPPLSGDIVRSFSADHPAVDIAAPVGSSVKAVLDGVVESAGWAGDRGNLLVVRSGSERSYYGHLQSFDAEPGDSIVAGQQVALSGSTGATNRPALHFEIHSAGEAMDPAPLLADA